jgi:hypothetical protein
LDFGRAWGSHARSSHHKHDDPLARKHKIGIPLYPEVPMPSSGAKRAKNLSKFQFCILVPLDRIAAITVERLDFVNTSGIARIFR